ncbi:MAG: fumarate hydratase C-terminal domain-containing protein [Rhodobacterales bacterium]|jgi:L(+)-tartrate dehydratase beta subunit|tara:strand:- start:560 stop:1237 length:678 start_codon:yes stop_codon:yes gene_type:complete
MVSQKTLTKIQLNTCPTADELAELNIGDVVYLNGLVYTARESVYTGVLDGDLEIPSEFNISEGANFHCSPAANQHEDGSFSLGAVSATASFRFSKWIGRWLEKTKSKIVIGKGGMSTNDYAKHFVPNKTIYLTTVGYGTGALLGRGVKKVKSLYWKKELGLAQAMWVLEVKNFGPFLVECDIKGNSLFEREHKKISLKIDKIYEGTRPAILKRLGETDDRKDELI